MDIASLSVNYSQASTLNDYGVAMLAKQLQTVKDSGENMIKMMEQSVHPELGKTIDVRV